VASLHRRPAVKKVPRPRRSVQRQSAQDWPSTPEIDGYVWELGPEPSEADAQWAAEYLNADDLTPDDVIDRLAEEAEAQDRIENGHLF
jgi:hypothetical protein